MPAHLFARLAPLLLIVSTALGGLYAPAAQGNSVSLLKDIDPTVDTRAGSPSLDHWASAGGVAYFAHADDAHGQELWKTDGTEAGTTLVKDIAPGNRTSNPKWFVAAGSKLYFAADDGKHGQELWVSDGTSDGTRMVKDVQPGAIGALTTFDIAPYGAGVVFAADDGTSGAEPWITDGTTAGTTQLKDVNPAPGTGSNPSNLWADGATLYFSANDGTHGLEPWISNGTAGGTQQLGDVNPGGSSQPGDFVKHGNTVLFSAVASSYRGIFAVNGGGTGYTEWTTSSALEPRMYGGGGLGAIVVLPRGGAPMAFYVCNSGSAGVELCDITDAGSAEVYSDVVSGSGSSSPLQLMRAGNRLYYVAHDGTNPNDRIFTTDGNGVPAQVTGMAYNTSRSQSWLIQPLGNDVLFSIPDSSGYELWRATGTVGTPVRDINPGVNDSLPAGTAGFQSVVLGSTVLFSAFDDTHGTEVWASDGTTGGTRLVRDIGAQVRSSNPSNFVTFGSKVLFRAGDPTHGVEQWITDGTAAGTELLADIRPGANGSSPYGHAQLGDAIYFIANDGTRGSELWKTDGTPSGTQLFLDLNPNGSASGVTGAQLFRLGNRLLFQGDDGSGDGPELWSTDGTVAGTTQIATIRGGSLGSYPEQFCLVGDRVYFAASDGTNGNELWSTDGTMLGTQLAANLNPGAAGSSPTGLVALGSTLLLNATTSGGGAIGTEPWAVSGTTATPLGDLNPGSATSMSGTITVVGGRGYFAATDGANGVEAWVTDGTPSGTTSLGDAATGSDGSYPYGFTAAGSRVVFAAYDAAHGAEAWSTDGTAAGTSRLRDLRAGFGDGMNGLLGSVDGRAYFAGDDGINGIELWSTDGTDAGTRLEADVWEGPSDGYPGAMLPVGRKGLLLSATRPGVGTEPVLVGPDELVTPISGPGAPEAVTLVLPKSGKLSTKKGTITLKIAVPSAGTLAITNGSLTGKRPKSYAKKVSVAATAAKTVTVVIKPTPTALKRLKAARKKNKPGTLKITLKATFTTSGGQIATATRAYTLKLK